MDTLPFNKLDFGVQCLEQAEKDIKNTSYSPLGAWSGIGLQAFQVIAQNLSPSDTLDLQTRILSSPLLRAYSRSPAPYSLSELACLDQVLSHCISLTQTPPTPQDAELFLTNDWWMSAKACIDLDVNLDLFPWSLVWKRGPLPTSTFTSSLKVSADINRSRELFLEKIDVLLSQSKAPASFLAYIPPSRLKNLINRHILDPEKLLSMVEKDPSLKMLASNALLITENCIALWDQTNPEKTREKVAEWATSHPLLSEACKVIPTAYYKGDKTPFDQWHWGLLSDWRKMMSSYKIGHRIDIAKTFQNIDILQGDMNTLHSYMEMAQVRPSNTQLERAASLKDFWSSALLFQSLNSNKASVASFWVSCSRPQFFHQVSKDIQEKVEREIEHLALLPKKELSSDLLPIRPFVAGAYQSILYRKISFNSQESEKAWLFLKNFPKADNQVPVVEKITQSIRSGVFSLTESEISGYLDQTSFGEKVKLELSTAQALASSVKKTKMKM